MWRRIHVPHVESCLTIEHMFSGGQCLAPMGEEDLSRVQILRS